MLHVDECFAAALRNSVLQSHAFHKFYSSRALRNQCRSNPITGCCSEQVYNESFVFEIPANLAAESGGVEGGLASLGLELQVLDWDRCALPFAARTFHILHTLFFLFHCLISHCLLYYTY